MTHTSHRSHQQPRQPAYVGVRGATPAQPTAAETNDDIDGAVAYLAIGRDDLAGTIHWLQLALKSRPDWQEALAPELDTLRNVLAALEQEMQP